MVGLTGCNFGPAKPDGFPRTLYPCTLTILSNGEPLKGAQVRLFITDESEKNWASGGTTDDGGVVNVYTYGKWEGLPKGTFKVTVEKTISEGPEGREVSYSLIDEKYNEQKTTPFELEVSGKTSQTFDVGAAVKKRVE
jgi:hypothetical protein